MKKIKRFGSIFSLFILFSCQNKQEKNTISHKKENTEDDSKSTTNFSYNLKNPTHSWVLPSDLVEVSGNAWIDKDHLLFIEDLKPNLYYVKFDLKNATLEKTVPFIETDKEKVDIEDVTIVDNVVYALWSHGVLFKITDWQNNPQIEKIKTGLSKDNNTEGLCFDPVTRQLLIACKDSSGTGEDSAKAVYSFNMESMKLNETPFMVIHPKDFIALTGSSLSFNPSAIAVHPVTHDIYVLTTRDNKGMAIFTHDGILKSYQPIEKELMEQPEGICFNPKGKLIISSEGKKGDPGNLFEFDPGNENGVRGLSNKQEKNKEKEKESEFGLKLHKMKY